MSTASTTPVRLTDTQREVLSAAMQRPDGAVVMLTRLKGKAAQTLVKALLGRKLVREVRAKGEMPVSRVDAETQRSFALILTKAGRASLATADQPSTPVASTEGAPAGSPSPTGPREGSKLASVIELLGREQGASVAELMTTMGWLPHTTRAVLTGLRKRGYALTREAAGGGYLYRIVTPSAAAA